MSEVDLTVLPPTVTMQSPAFQSGSLTQLSGPHFGNQHAVLGGVEEIGQLRGQRGQAHADLTAVGDEVVTRKARRLAFGNLAVANLSFDVSAALLSQLAERFFLVEEAARPFSSPLRCAASASLRLSAAEARWALASLNSLDMGPGRSNGAVPKPPSVSARRLRG